MVGLVNSLCRYVDQAVLEHNISSHSAGRRLHNPRYHACHATHDSTTFLRNICLNHHESAHLSLHMDRTALHQYSLHEIIQRATLTRDRYLRLGKRILRSRFRQLVLDRESIPPSTLQPQPRLALCHHPHLDMHLCLRLHVHESPSAPAEYLELWFQYPGRSGPGLCEDRGQTPGSRCASWLRLHSATQSI